MAQVFTSTLAGGGYSDRPTASGALRDVCRQLLRGAYLGTLLAAVALGRRVAVLTLIGGGVFGNPPALIWESILWALDEVDRVAPGPLEVFVNGRTLARAVPIDELAAAARARGGGGDHPGAADGHGRLSLLHGAPVMVVLPAGRIDYAHPERAAASP